MPITVDTLKKYTNKYFVETGTQWGNGVHNALEAGFPHVISIELSLINYSNCYELFKDNDKVTLYQGDSELLLESIIKGIEEPITFWLDAHHPDDTTAPALHNCALMRELETIRNHPVKTHTLLIDDVRCWETEFFLNKEEVIKSILAINPDYEIFYEDGHISNDILVAIV